MDYEEKFQDRLRKRETSAITRNTPQTTPEPPPTFDKDDPPDNLNALTSQEPAASMAGDPDESMSSVDFQALPVGNQLQLLFEMYQEQKIRFDEERRRAKEEIALQKKHHDLQMKQFLELLKQNSELKELFLMMIKQIGLETPSKVGFHPTPQSGPIRSNQVGIDNLHANEIEEWKMSANGPFKYSEAAKRALSPSYGGTQLTSRGTIQSTNRYQALMNSTPEEGNRSIDGGYTRSVEAQARQLERRTTNNAKIRNLNQDEMENMDQGRSAKDISPMVKLFFEGLRRNRITDIKSYLKTLGIDPSWVRNISFIGKCIMELSTFEDKKRDVINKLYTRNIKWLENYDPLSIENIRDEKKLAGLSKVEKEALACRMLRTRTQRILDRLPHKETVNRRHANMLTREVKELKELEESITGKPVVDSKSPLVPRRQPAATAVSTQPTG